MQKATHAPVYAAMYPDLAEITRKHGYALAVHGSLARDFDLIAIPWVENPSKPIEVINAITQKFAISVEGEPTLRLHNRIVYTITVGWGECFFDFSFMPMGIPLQEILALVSYIHADMENGIQLAPEWKETVDKVHAWSLGHTSHSSS